MNGDLSGANALRLMGALVKSGAQADVPIANARVSDVAVQTGLDGDGAGACLRRRTRLDGNWREPRVDPHY
jgi:hypothetical protein